MKRANRSRQDQPARPADAASFLRQGEAATDEPGTEKPGTDEPGTDMRPIASPRIATDRWHGRAGLPPLVALVGCDGSGKSTVGAALLAWMQERGATELCHLGKQTGNAGRALVRWPIVGRFFDKTISTGTKTAKERGAGMFTALVVYGFSMRRMRRFRRMLAIRARGVAILADRFPQLSVPGAFDGPGLAKVRPATAFARMLALRERGHFEWMASHRPDLVIRLNVDLATAIARKPDHRPEALARKIMDVARLSFDGAPIVDIDANQPLSLVLEQATRAVANMLGEGDDPRAAGAAPSPGPTAGLGTGARPTRDMAPVDEPRFTAAQCDALFAAVLIDDEIDAHTELPERITLDYSDRQLVACFAISRQLWATGVRRDELLSLTRALWRDGDLGAEDRLRFKHARARFKHLRFAHGLYDARHRYPLMLDWITTAMGHLQDAFKNGRRNAMAREAVLARLFLSAPSQWLLAHEIRRFSPASGADFRAYLLKQVATLRRVLARDEMTGAQFHATRKIISRQVSFYDTLRTIEPSAEAYRMSRALAAINGLMGAMHDDLVRQRIAGTRDYHRAPFALPPEIRQRLTMLVDRYPR